MKQAYTRSPILDIRLSSNHFTYVNKRKYTKYNIITIKSPLSIGVDTEGGSKVCFSPGEGGGRGEVGGWEWERVKR